MKMNPRTLSVKPAPVPLVPVLVSLVITISCSPSGKLTSDSDSALSGSAAVSPQDPGAETDTLHFPDTDPGADFRATGPAGSEVHGMAGS